MFDLFLELRGELLQKTLLLKGSEKKRAHEVQVDQPQELSKAWLIASQSEGGALLQSLSYDLTIKGR